MKNGITANIGGLKCDKPSCDYVDMSVKLEQYVTYINEPCPKCGSSLLTQEDFDQVQRILSAIDLVNDLPEPSEKSKGKSKISFEFDGTGKVEMNIEKY